MTSHSEQPVAAIENLKIQHKYGTLDEVRMVCPGLEPLRMDDIRVVSMLTDLHQDPARAYQTGIHGMEEDHVGTNMVVLFVPEYKQRRIRPCN